MAISACAGYAIARRARIYGQEALLDYAAARCLGSLYFMPAAK